MTYLVIKHSLDEDKGDDEKWQLNEFIKTSFRRLHFHHDFKKFQLITINNQLEINATINFSNCTH